MKPEMFSIGNISIRWYSVMILLGIMVAFVLAILEAGKKGIKKDDIFDLGFYVIIFGIIGARLYYVLFNLDFYKSNLLEIFKIWNGGLAIHGGIIFGLITLIVYCKKKNLKILEVTDIVVPSLLIAQAIGRWGNFFNSEAHGPVTSLEFLENMKIIPQFVIDVMKINGNYYHPTFYYEFLWCLLGFVIIILIRKIFKKRKDGFLAAFYLIWYGIGRAFIESLRTDSLMLGNFKVAQIVSLVGVISGVVLCFVIFFRKGEKE